MSVLFRQIHAFIVRMLGRAPQNDAPESGLSRLNDVVCLGLEPLGDCLTSGDWNQAAEDDGTAWFALDGESADSKGLHSALEERPVITDDSSRF